MIFCDLELNSNDEKSNLSGSYLTKVQVIKILNYI